FIKGFIYRNHPRCPENEYFLDYIRFSFLMNLRRNLPKNVLDKSWPTPPPSLCESWWRGTLGRRKAAKRKWAVETIRRFIKGFIYRNHPRCPENEYFLDYIRFSFLMNLRRNLPKNVLDKSWPTPPPSLCEASQLLRQLCMQNMVWTYCKRISPEWKQQYAVPVIKYDRKGYKARSRQLLLTQNAVVIVEDSKIKQRIDYANLTGISVSSLSDNLFVLHVHCEDNKQKGDVVLQSDHVIETLTKTAMRADKVNNININQGSIKFTVGQGKEGVIDFISGSELLIAKAKNGHLTVSQATPNRYPQSDSEMIRRFESHIKPYRVNERTCKYVRAADEKWH
ncbi:UNVERIFIED_CONTAM: hypothetical protein H355_012314, partial [Colinus virginianus]